MPHDVPARAATLTLLYLPVGRGHPFYLDGIADALIRAGQIGLVRATDDVFESSTGLSKLGWKAVRWLYRAGSSGGMIGKVYDRIRHDSDYNKPRTTLTLLGRDLKRKYARSGTVVVVSHPMLVGILRGHARIIYQHGELVAPRESLVAGAEAVIVPTGHVARSFIDFGYPPDRVVISGLCVEPALARQGSDAYHLRRARIAGGAPLTGAFFSSGAEPRAHIEKLVAAALAAAMLEHRVIIFARRQGNLAKAAAQTFERQHVPLHLVTAEDLIPSDLPRALLVEFDNRREETGFTAKLFPWFDYLVAPSHERTNWAVGLGLPMFILEPCFGTFAPLNRQLLLDRGVATRLTSMNHAHSFGARLESLRNKGALLEQATAGWGEYPIDGCEQIAHWLMRRYADKPDQDLFG